MTGEAFDQDSWERRWRQALREHADVVATRPPNTHLLTVTADLPPGLALDAGCGHGAETLWLAAHGWRVTAVDFAATALDHARSSAEAIGTDVAERVDWIQGDLATWTPPPGRYDLVTCLYARQVQISVNTAVTALDPSEWEVIVAEDRPRATAGTGVDAVVQARRLP